MQNISTEIQIKYKCRHFIAVEKHPMYYETKVLYSISGNRIYILIKSEQSVKEAYQ